MKGYYHLSSMMWDVMTEPESVDLRIEQMRIMIRTDMADGGCGDGVKDGIGDQGIEGIVMEMD
jgi:hypothetical protein